MPKVRGPRDGKLITASFDGKEKSLFPSLKTTKDLVLLSIRGNEYCTGEYLGAIVQQAVATHQTPIDHSGAKGKATFLIADEIYWHNIKQMISSESEVEILKQEAIKIGADYFLTNLGAFLTPLDMTIEQFNEKYPEKSVDEIITIINQLADEQGKNFEIVRWKTWVAQNDSQEKINKMMGFYDSVEGLKESVIRTQNNFVKRHGKDGDEELWKLRSHDYLIEESPAVMWLAASLGYNFIVYPGEILPPFEATKEFFVVPNHVPRISQGKNIIEECEHNEYSIHTDNPNRLVNWLEVNFKRSHPPKQAGVSVENEVTSVGKSFASVEQPLVSVEKKMSFFSSSPRKKTKVRVLDKQVEDNVTMDLPLSNPNALMLGSALEGIGKALISKHSNGKIQSKSSSILSEAFAGITHEVLSSDLSPSDQVNFLVSILNGVMKGNGQSCTSESDTSILLENTKASFCK
ncbi:hypothetical protein [Legionella longbeachae]|uniref:Uncharacterized protein n=1 Tax=Legionella longbeachae serogroup 1 (strain NSW150) TaxID=661367 RepID=D3HK57_LEGLN|nr:hypothetical protein [Legionella longbeachae]VEE03338.1 Uncharacterised protein [Legionella oakridgensis]HBD7399188.1 hypothetical protein [Legionella pneumophila]ARB93765.1 hypothetical protein A6J40_16990 [Legionella longbeachae]ARM33095.1 hypothetical protein B0B39_05965 [Legionella longbeachae]EEZ94069.1 hypothetical protein LLB_2968 [Legionella longbeachae D-4968]